ncbi:MAG: thymidylate synthase [Synechococcus sp.]
MVSLSIPGLLSGGTAAVLALVGLVGWQQASGRRSTDHLLASAAVQQRSTEEALSTHLARRELTLDLRRESEALIQQFIRAQMTSHYWGQFASSLVDLGLSSGDLLDARVESDPRETRLWLSSPQATEAYVAIVKRGGARLTSQRCKGDPAQLGRPFNGPCPEGWSSWSF